MPQLMSADTNDDRQKDRRFSWKAFRQITTRAYPYRGRIAMGFLLTLIFAGIHTLSIATVLPVLKVLLEDEGLTGWMHRSVLASRLEVTLGPPTASDPYLRVLKRPSDPTEANDLRVGDLIKMQGDTGIDLHTLATMARTDREAIDLTIVRENETKQINATLLGVSMQERLWLSIAGWFPTDASNTAGKFKTLTMVLVGLVVLVVVGNTLRYLGQVMIASAVLQTMVDLRAELYERVLQLPLAFFAGQSTSDLVTNFVQDMQVIQRGLLTFFGKFLREPLKAMLILGLALALDWRITLTLVIAVPLAVIVFGQVGKRVKRANRKLLQGYSVMINTLTTSLQNLPVVKTYTAEQQERKHLSAVDRHMFRQQLKLARLEAFVSPMVEVLAVVATAVATGWLGSLVLKGELSLATFGTLGVALAMVFDPLRKLTDVYVRLQQSTVGAERIFSVLEQPIESDSNKGHETAQPLKRAIEFDRVSFTYPGAERPALDQVSVTIHQGETVALVGPNGSGKSTFANLIPRLRNPDNGEIRYDGVPLTSLDLHALREQISIVSQDAVVFAGTPARNISYGVDQPDPEAIRDAAARAFANDFIMSMPGEFEADLGERGTTLSGGQRQRLAIARAIYRDAPILIFDEATSQIDAESEQQIQTALQEFAADRTTIIIAHRLSTIQFADRIIVMENGQAIDQGKHDELYERCTFYRRLCDTQLAAQS
ncbi:MAG: ABC transporter ATP-binding protein [Phycisphaerae bacterium]